MLRLDVLRTFDSLRRIEPQWRELHLEAGASFANSPTWLTAWWDTMRDAGPLPFRERELLAVAMRDGAGALVGLALFVRRWVRVALVPRLRLEALGTGEPKEDEVCTDYPTVLARAEHRAEVVELLVQALLSGELGRWDELQMSTMRRDDPVVDLFVQAFVRARVGVSVEPAPAATAVKLAPTFDGYLATLPKKHRYAVKRTLSDFDAWANERGGSSFERVGSRGELAAGVRTLIELHAARWGPRHLFTSERFRRFHEQVMASFMDGVDGRLDLWILRAGGEPVAALYNIVCGRVVNNYQGGRLVDLPKGIKPGMVANLRAIQRAIAEGLAEYDFLPGEALYKHQLGNLARPVVALNVSRSDTRAVGLELFSAGIRRIATSVGLAHDQPAPSSRPRDSRPGDSRPGDWGPRDPERG